MVNCKLTWRWEQGRKREQGTGKEKEMVNGLDSTFPQETVRRTTEGREVQAMVGSFIQNVFIETMIEQERMRSGRMWLGTGWSPDPVVQCGALSLPPDSSQGSEHQAAVGRRWGEGSPLSAPSCLARGASEPRGQPCRAH